MSQPTVGRYVEALEAIAPTRYAEEWDNVGLLLGDAEWPATRTMLAIDLVDEVLEEAIEREVGLIVAYHPALFRPTNRLTADHPRQRVILGCARAGIAIHSPHTALDAAPGGVNDWLAGGLGAGDVRALLPRRELPTSEARKLVTFCPADAVESIRGALATIGAGRIGDYQLCSFETAGHGTFMGGEGTNPTVGRAGALERVPEVRLEMVCSDASLPLAMLTLQQVHPYEEPAIEVHPLAPRPVRGTGSGRRLTLDQPATLEALIERTKETLGVRSLRFARGRGAPAEHQVLAMCAGAGGSMVDEAVAQGCDCFLTGEMRHHDVLAAVARGLTLILPGHTNTERGFLPRLRERLVEQLGADPGADALFVSERDRSPFEVG